MPGRSNVTSKPLIVQIEVVVEVSVTVKPEVAVAVTLIDGGMMAWSPGLANVMVWARLADGERPRHRGGRLVIGAAGLAWR